MQISKSFLFLQVLKICTCHIKNFNIGYQRITANDVKIELIKLTIATSLGASFYIEDQY